MCRGLSVQLPPNFHRSRILFIQPNPSEALAWQLSSSQRRRYLLLGSKQSLCRGVPLTPQEPTLLSGLRVTQRKPSQGSVETTPSHVFLFPGASSSIGLHRPGRDSIPLIPNQLPTSLLFINLSCLPDQHDNVVIHHSGNVKALLPFTLELLDIRTFVHF